ncbi:MAG: hypothetical protein WCI81_07525 [Chlorobiaceae bacterium]
MDRLFRWIDVSLVTTIISGLLYVLGYNYYLFYYSYFGINLLVRDPEMAYLFKKGFDFSGYLLIIIFLTVVVYMALHHIFLFVNAKINSITLQQGKSMAAALSLCAFMFAFTSLLDYVQGVAEYSAMTFVKARQSGQATIFLTDGKKLPGSFSFFFLNKNNVVLFNTGVPMGKKPKLTIVPSVNVSYLEVN